MEIKECTRSLQVCIRGYLNDKSDMIKYLQKIEIEVSSKNNVESKQHDKWHKKIAKITSRNFKVSRDLA